MRAPLLALLLCLPALRAAEFQTCKPDTTAWTTKDSPVCGNNACDNALQQTRTSAGTVDAKASICQYQCATSGYDLVIPADNEARWFEIEHLSYNNVQNASETVKWTFKVKDKKVQRQINAGGFGQPVCMSSAVKANVVKAFRACKAPEATETNAWKTKDYCGNSTLCDYAFALTESSKANGKDFISRCELQCNTEGRVLVVRSKLTTVTGTTLGDWYRVVRFRATDATLKYDPSTQTATVPLEYEVSVGKIDDGKLVGVDYTEPVCMEKAFAEKKTELRYECKLPAELATGKAAWIGTAKCGTDTCNADFTGVTDITKRCAFACRATGDLMVAKKNGRWYAVKYFGIEEESRRYWRGDESSLQPVYEVSVGNLYQKKRAPGQDEFSKPVCIAASMVASKVASTDNAQCSRDTNACTAFFGKMKKAACPDDPEYVSKEDCHHEYVVKTTVSGTCEAHCKHGSMRSPIGAKSNTTGVYYEEILLLQSKHDTCSADEPDGLSADSLLAYSEENRGDGPVTIHEATRLAGVVCIYTSPIELYENERRMRELKKLGEVKTDSKEYREYMHIRKLYKAKEYEIENGISVNQVISVTRRKRHVEDMTEEEERRARKPRPTYELPDEFQAMPPRRRSHANVDAIVPIVLIAIAFLI